METITVRSASPAALNTDYMLLFPTATGFKRIWYNNRVSRIAFDNCWYLASGDLTVTYYQLMEVVTEDYQLQVATDQGVVKLAYTAPKDPWVTTVTRDFKVGDYVWYRPDTHTIVELSVIGEDRNFETKVTETSTNADGLTVVSTTYTNTVTGDKRREVTTIKPTTEHEVVEHDRTAVPIVKAGQVYRFTFTDDFAALGYVPPSYDDGDLTTTDEFAGIYRVEKIVSYTDVLANAIDIYRNLYVPCGVPQEVYQQDEERFSTQSFYKLVNPNNVGQVYYIPEFIIVGVPDPGICQYNQMALTVNLGLYASDDKVLYDVQDLLKRLLQARVGLPADVAENIKLVSYNAKWCTREYFENLIARLPALRDYYLQQHGSELYGMLFATEHNQLYQDYLTLRRKVEVYEQELERLYEEKKQEASS